MLDAVTPTLGCCKALFVQAARRNDRRGQAARATRLVLVDALSCALFIDPFSRPLSPVLPHECTAGRDVGASEREGLF